MLDVSPSSLASQLLHGNWRRAWVLRSTRPPCRSWLASESGGSVDIDVGCQAVFAGKPAPTRELASCLGPAIDTAPL
ncbi:hypothetical protein ELQ88_11505 [Pseudomonas sp. MPC6]|nr:hypothetical protein ELQ88_11505 [Pseudomonas sp. MPC6]